MKSVYSAVRTGSLNKALCASSLKDKYENNRKLYEYFGWPECRDYGVVARGAVLSLLQTERS